MFIQSVKCIDFVSTCLPKTRNNDQLKITICQQAFLNVRANYVKHVESVKLLLFLNKVFTFV